MVEYFEREELEKQFCLMSHTVIHNTHRHLFHQIQYETFYGKWKKYERKPIIQPLHESLDISGLPFSSPSFCNRIYVCDVCLRQHKKYEVLMAVADGFFQ